MLSFLPEKDKTMDKESTRRGLYTKQMGVLATLPNGISNISRLSIFFNIMNTK